MSQSIGLYTRKTIPGLSRILPSKRIQHRTRLESIPYRDYKEHCWQRTNLPRFIKTFLAPDGLQNQVRVFDNSAPIPIHLVDRRKIFCGEFTFCEPNTHPNVLFHALFQRRINPDLASRTFAIVLRTQDSLRRDRHEEIYKLDLNGLAKLQESAHFTDETSVRTFLDALTFDQLRKARVVFTGKFVQEEGNKAETAPSPKPKSRSKAPKPAQQPKGPQQSLLAQLLFNF